MTSPVLTPIRILVTTASLLMLVGCATDRLDLAPPSPDKPWSDGNRAEAYLRQDLTLPANPRAAEQPAPPTIDARHDYTLPELIDLAQRQNPDTRIAWEQARQAAIAVGMAEATYLPILSASVIGGYQKTHTPLSHPIGDYSSFNTTNSAVVPALGLKWLLFDFGQRGALVDGTRHASFAANALFNGVHQKVVYSVTHAYYLYGAALSRRNITEEMSKNSAEVLAAAEERRRQGIATVIEVALARQQVAQSTLQDVQAKGMLEDSWQGLLRALGVSPLTAITVAYDENLPLPKTLPRPTETMIMDALSQRPDVQASYAASLAAQSAVKVTEADFLPKVYLAGALASGHGSFEAEGLPAATPRTSSSNILLGISLPLYDGGIRSARVQEAASRLSVANDTLQKIQDDAYREIVIASNALRSALEAHRAAVELVKTSSVTFDAALDAYRHGVGTVTVANEAANSLLNARQMQVDAYAAARVAAANLAFVMGKTNES